jgi:hypothetical protein
MNKRFVFRDGTTLNVAGQRELYSKRVTYVYTNCVYASRVGGVVKTLWSGDKYDIDGNRWNLSGLHLQIFDKNNNRIFDLTPDNSFTGNLVAVFVLGPSLSTDYTASTAFYRVEYYNYCNDLTAFSNHIRNRPSWPATNADTEERILYYYPDDAPNNYPFGVGSWLKSQYFTNTYQDAPTDPYTPGGESHAGGGTGTFSDNSDPVDFPELPSLSAADTGFITLFTPTLSQLRNLASYMWSDLFTIETFKKIFANPMDAILGLSIVPVDVPTAGAKDVTVGNISTDISMFVAASQYVEVDCGSLNIQEFWGAYLDYAPFTKCSIYLPYIGTRPIKTDDVMGKTVHIKYHVDILSGACAAYVKCGDSVLYQFIGQVSSSIPVSSVDFTNVINGALNIVSAVGTMVATGGFSAPASVAKLGADAASDYTRGHKWSAGASMVQDVMGMKPEVERSGAISGTGGMLSTQVPYMILERPNQALPTYQNDFTGYPSFITKKLGNVTGYTEVESIHLEHIPCTEKEADEIVAFLENGVIL